MPCIATCLCVGLMRSAYGSVWSARRAVIKNLAASISLAIFLVFCHASAMRAQVPAAARSGDAPVLPMDIKFRHVPQYFEQSFAGDPRYARIEALVDEEGCDIILLDKATNREAVYSNLQRRVHALAADGIDAYNTPVDFVPASTDDSNAAFRFHLHDQFGQDVTWRFVAGEMVPHASPELVFYTHSGVTLLYAPRRAPAAPGTVLTIAGSEYAPSSTQSRDSLAGFYATDMTISAILPGTGLWNVESSPDDIAQPAAWILTGSSGQRRILTLKQVSDTEAAVDQIDPNNPDVPHLILNLVRANGAYAVSSLLFEADRNKLWIFFGPALPLTSRQIDQTIVTFTIAENEQASVATGELKVQRINAAERLLWRFDTPDAVRGTTFITGVNLVPGAREQARCVNENCSDLR